jgi:4-hydroxybenzoate polyprenyltransferase/phosphoserine phosphatase
MSVAYAEQRDHRGQSAARRRPICVDLDGTLVNTDLLVEACLSIVSSRRGLLSLPALLRASRAEFKLRASALAELNPETLPYNSQLIAFLRRKKRAGYPIVLATAASREFAEAVASHLDLFDEIISSDGVRNLKGEEKSKELVRRFGAKGFDYVGNDAADLAVWKEANGIIIVNASRSVAEKARRLGRVAAEFTEPRSVLLTALRAMRPHQWVKNLLVFVPLLAARSFETAALLGALCMFASFCATASGIYLINDLTDLAADRRHPRKRLRPFASGALSLPLGATIAAALMTAGFILAFMAGAVYLLIAYAAISLAYSFAFKKFPLLDVFILASLYTLRIIAGGVASGLPVTLWLLAFSLFVFLSLALIKRTAELRAWLGSPEERSATRRGYVPGDRNLLLMFGVASSFASCVVLALFVSTQAALYQYRAPEILWAVIPLILFWQCRLWLATERGHMHDDPIVYASRDWVSWMVAVSVLVTLLAASWSPAIW